MTNRPDQVSGPARIDVFLPAIGDSGDRSLAACRPDRLGPGGEDGVLNGRVIIDEHPELDLLQDDRDSGIGQAYSKRPARTIESQVMSDQDSDRSSRKVPDVGEVDDHSPGAAVEHEGTARRLGSC